MKQALIIYQSKTGTTKKYGFAIRDFLTDLGIEAKAIPVQNYTEEDFNNADHIFLGCWTSGLFFILQHPDKIWNQFAAKLPAFNGKKVAFFTTYKLLAGSMFKKMKQQLNRGISDISLTLKARSTMLSEKDKQNLKNFIQS